MEQEKQNFVGSLEKQIAAHERANGRSLSPDAIKASGRAIDGEPYTSEERAPAVAQKGALNWNSGNHVHSPLERPEPAQHHGLTSTPRVDSGKNTEEI